MIVYNIIKLWDNNMDNSFIFDDKESKGIWKIVLIIVAVVLCLGALLAILIGSSVIESIGDCEKVSQQTGIDISRCEEKFEQIVFVIGDTANTRKPTIDDADSGIISSMYDIENNGIKGLSYVSVSNPDDAPQPFDTNKKGAKKIKEAVKKQIESSHATVNGADYLEAIRNAALYAKDKGNTLIYVIGSGLSDTGLLNFADGDLLFGHSTEEIRGAISDAIDDKKALRGLTVFWEGLGDTIEPQEQLNADLKQKEKDIYSATLQELGLNEDNFIEKKTNVKSEKNESVKTTVKTTSVKNQTLVFDYSSDNSELAFNPGTAVFKDKKAAEAEVKNFVKKYKNAIYTIKPFQSRGMCDRDKDEELLNSRSEATKQLFIDAGVSVADIRTEEGEIGDANECPNGLGHCQVDESFAPMNRKVRISVMKK